MLTVTKLTISFPPHPPVVQDLSFTLETGQRMGILGLSGSGKSMTAMALIGLLPAGARVDSGKALYQPIDGPTVDLLQLSEKDWRGYRARAISLVFQEPLTALNPVHRVGDQLLEAVRLLCPAIKKASRKAHVLEWLNRVELADERERILTAYPHQLSGGQRQRILIALALLGGPRLLIADEPTTALDTITEAGILRLLSRLRSELGMASIFITHDLGVMAKSADELIVMAGGKTIRRGNAGEVLKMGEQLFTPVTAAGKGAEIPVKRRPYLSGTSTDAPGKPPALRVSNLHLSYPTPAAWPWSKTQPNTVVQDVSLSLQAGEWLAIVGPSGCGKTSIARCLAGLMTPDGGQIDLAAGGNVQLVFQDPFSSLNPAHTIRRTLMEVLRVHLPGKKKATYQTEAGRLLDEVGLPAKLYADRKPSALSGGQRQRVAIARALAANPTVLIADEAVSALDAPLRRDVLDLLDDIRREQQIALLFISHDLALVAERADRVLIMDAGQVVERGNAAAVFSAPGSVMGQRLVAAAG